MTSLRDQLSILFSTRRSVALRVPFWKTSVHRIPTLWGLYRDLLRNAPTPRIANRIKQLFRENRHLTGTKATISKLELGYKWLDIFVNARADSHSQATLVLARYDQLLAARENRLRWHKQLQDELAWQERLRTRPILTGSVLRATLYNKPLPRLKPQPLAITMMIKQRRESRDRRGLKLQGLHEWMDDLRRERAFERELLKDVKNSDSTPFEPVYDDPSWDAPLHDLRRRYIDSLENDVKRCQTPIPPSLISAITSARTYKIANKVREKQRERSGEILNITLRRRRKGPPPDVLSRMNPDQRKMDRIVRSSVSEVGYVGKIKKRMGWTLKDPEAWKVENYGGEAVDKTVDRSRHAPLSE